MSKNEIAATRDEWDNSTYKAYYGAGASFNRQAPDFGLCCESVGRDQGRWTSFGQCQRKRGFGPGGAYCKQHDPAAVAARKAERHAAWQAQNDASMRQYAMTSLGKKAILALREIAAGHNDPCALASETLAEFDAKYPPAEGTNP